MGTDDLFKKRRAERQKRKHEFKSVNTNSFLIVTEGEKSEPLYFKGLQKKINEKVNGRIDIRRKSGYRYIRTRVQHQSVDRSN